MTGLETELQRLLFADEYIWFTIEDEGKQLFILSEECRAIVLFHDVRQLRCELPVDKNISSTTKETHRQKAEQRLMEVKEALEVVAMKKWRKREVRLTFPYDQRRSSNTQTTYVVCSVKRPPMGLRVSAIKKCAEPQKWAEDC